MRQLAQTLLFLLVLVIGSLAIGPGLVEWTRYRGDIAEILSAAAGRPVTIDGAVDLELLPTPRLGLGAVTIATIDGGQAPHLVGIDRLEVELGLFALLGGRIEVEQLTLDDPDLRLETLADGRPNWRLAPDPVLTTDSEAARIAADLGLEPRELAASVRLKEVRVVDGRVSWLDGATGVARTISEIDGMLAASSLFGPYAADASVKHRGQRLRVLVTAGRARDGAPMPLRVELALPDDDAEARLVGLITGNDTDGLRLEGDLRLAGSDLGRGLAAATALTSGAPVPADPAPAVPVAIAEPFTVTAALTATGRGVEARALSLDLGVAGAPGALATDDPDLPSLSATGTADLSFGLPHRVTADLALGTVALDPWLARHRATLVALLARLGGPLAEARLPETVDGTLKIALDAVRLGDAALRHGRLAAELANGTLTVERLSALGPGNASVRIGATLGRENDQPLVDATIDLGTDDLRAVLDWVGVGLDGVPADRLRRLALAGRVRGRPAAFQVTNLDLALDDTRLIGGLAFVDRGRPAFGVRLEIDQLTLDGYRPLLGDRAPGELVGLLDRFDATIDARVNTLVVGGVPVRGVACDLTLNGGALTLRSARVTDLAGIGGTLHGRVVKITEPAGLDLQVTAQARTLAPLVAALRRPPAGAAAAAPPGGTAVGTAPPLIGRLGPVSLNGRVTGDRGTIGLELKAGVLGGTVEAGGAVRVPAAPADAEADIKLRATFPGLLRPVQAIWPDYLPPSGDPGPLDLYTELAGTAGRWAFANSQGTVGGVSVKGDVTLGLDGARPRIDAEIQTGTLGLDRFLSLTTPFPGGLIDTRVTGGGGWSSRPYDLAWLGAVDGTLAMTSHAIVWQGHRLTEPAVAARLADGTVTLSALDAGLLGGRVAATGMLAAASDGALELGLETTVTGARVAQALFGASLGPWPVDLAEGTLDLTLALAGRGATPAALVAALDGAGRVAVRDGRLRGIGLGRAIDRMARVTDVRHLTDAFTRGLDGGDSALARFEADFQVADGVATADGVALDAERASGVGRVVVDLPAYRVDGTVALALAHQPPLPPIELALAGDLAAPRLRFGLEALRAALDAQVAEALAERLRPGAGAGPSGLIRDLIDGFRR